jgi:putative IMPACT (imprinted ancient) family translation regulator
MLAAIQGSRIWNVVVVVTRYFGGIKLGAGGLARAYGKAARDALTVLKTRERVRCQALGIQVDYSFLETLRRLVALHEGEIQKETFSAQVESVALIPLDRLKDFQQALTQASGGSARAEPHREIG